jgi:hypothetical protein
LHELLAIFATKLAQFALENRELDYFLAGYFNRIDRLPIRAIILETPHSGWNRVRHIAESLSFSLLSDWALLQLS